MIYLYIALGGAAGALARFGLGGWISGWARAGFPWGTLGVNLLGALLLGVVLRWAPEPESAGRALLAIGFCGSFTTFSTFGYEALALLQADRPGTAAAYVIGSALLGTGAVAAGLGLASLIMRSGG